MCSPAAFVENHLSAIGLESHPSNMYRYFRILKIKKWHLMLLFLDICYCCVLAKALTQLFGLFYLSYLCHLERSRWHVDPVSCLSALCGIIPTPGCYRTHHISSFRQLNLTPCLQCEIRFIVHRRTLIHTWFDVLEYEIKSYPQTCSYPLYNAENCTNSSKSPNL